MPEGGAGCLVGLARFMDCVGTGRQGTLRDRLASGRHLGTGVLH